MCNRRGWVRCWETGRVLPVWGRTPPPPRPGSIPGDIPGDTGCRCQQLGWGMPQGAGEGVHLAGGEAERRVPDGCPSPELALRALLTHPGAELCAAKAGPERMNRFRPEPIWFLLRGSAASSLPAAQPPPRPAHPSPPRRESEDSRPLASSPALPAAAPGLLMGVRQDESPFDPDRASELICR